MQTKIAFLERAIQELSDVMFRQDKAMRDMRARLQAVCDQLAGASSDGISSLAQEIPPHY